MMQRWKLYTLVGGLIVLGGIGGGWWYSRLRQSPGSFQGARAYTDVLAQMEAGPRLPGSPASQKVQAYITAQLQQAGWAVVDQPFEYQGVAVHNLIGQANLGRGPVIIVGAHYDSRARADQDPMHPNDPVPGANDGASGVAVLLELARTLNLDLIDHEIHLAFFDAEDNGSEGLPGWDWLAGSTYMAQHLDSPVDAMILVDMVGDADQQIYYEANSNAGLSRQIWGIAGELGYAQWIIPSPKYRMIDDHMPFVERGIRAVDLIDFDYTNWHTTGDTADKVSAASLERVGRTLETYLERQTP